MIIVNTCFILGLSTMTEKYKGCIVEIRREQITPQILATITKQSGHCFIYSRNGVMEKPIILMQLREDGYLGFPGGFMDPTDETIEDALNRELVEEFALDMKKYMITSKNYFISHYREASGYLAHFFTIEVSKEQIIAIERKTLDSMDYGKEVFGTIRVPLFTLEGSNEGFPIFIQQHFVGYAKQQLLHTIEKLGFLTREEIQNTLKVHK